MKDKIMDRPMFKKAADETDVENVGIMQGFMDGMEEDDSEDEYEMDDSEAMKVANRRPNSPEILMNNLRGDMRSIDARVEELADLVGYNAAADTPEDVLALLQPVLAQQQAAPMPPQGGIPAVVPQGMPGMMPEAMPAEAGMGGIGALPTDQGAAPVAMAMGGYVQNFRDGTDEDGVTPIEDTSSFPAGTFDDATLTQARNRLLATINAKPMAAPDLESGVNARSAMYERLLGMDKNQTQAQILAELGNRAFNYAANVDDQGRPLRGSGMARFAGAIRTLPTAVTALAADADKQKRAIRSMAITASEKDIENVRDYNAKLAATQQRADAAVLKAGKGTPDKGFGTGVEGVAQTLLADYALDYANGTLDPKLTRRFESALKIVTQPVQYTDPETGNVVTRVPELPAYVVNAVKARSQLTGATPGATPSPADGTWTGGELPPAELAQLQQAARDGNVDAQKALVAYERRNTTAAAPTPAPGMSLWNAAEYISGPVAAGQALITQIPGLGSSFPEVTQAREYTEVAVNGIVSALRTTDRFGNSEREEIKQDLGLTPQVMGDKDALRNKLIGITAFIDQEKAQAQRKFDNKDLNVELRKKYSALIQDMDNALKIINPPPRIYSLEEVAKLRPGESFIWNGTTLKTRKK